MRRLHARFGEARLSDQVRRWARASSGYCCGGLSDEARARLRAVILSHDNDPIAVLGSELIVQRPHWLANGRRGHGVPEGMRWNPLVTFVQTAMDAANATASTSSCGPWSWSGPSGSMRSTGGARWFRGEAHPPPTPTG